METIALLLSPRSRVEGIEGMCLLWVTIPDGEEDQLEKHQEKTPRELSFFRPLECSRISM
jgi:hypothetical protein